MRWNWLKCWYISKWRIPYFGVYVYIVHTCICMQWNLKRTPLGLRNVSLLERCPLFQRVNSSSFLMHIRMYVHIQWNFLRSPLGDQGIRFGGKGCPLLSWLEMVKCVSLVERCSYLRPDLWKSWMVFYCECMHKYNLQYWAILMDALQSPELTDDIIVCRCSYLANLYVIQTLQTLNYSKISIWWNLQNVWIFPDPVTFRRCPLGRVSKCTQARAEERSLTNSSPPAAVYQK